jgi:hypothetical protein
VQLLIEHSVPPFSAEVQHSRNRQTTSDCTKYDGTGKGKHTASRSPDFDVVRVVETMLTIKKMPRVSANVSTAQGQSECSARGDLKVSMI